MWENCARQGLMTTALLLVCIAIPCRAISVATVGDSFADSLYNAMRARPDLMRQYGVQLTRWSRPIVGLTRNDYFDYTGWLRDANDLGSVDVCLVQIGSNDMQSIPVSKNQLSRNQVSRNQFSRNQWIAYGTPQWRDAYAARTRELALVLTERRCGQLLWLLQPGFEKQAALACHRELIDEVQRDALRLERVRVLEPETSEADYGPDKTHFNRAYLLQLGPALFHLVDTSGQILHMGCLACHRNIAGIARDSGILPLRAWQGESVLPVWAPERLGMQCRAAFVRVRKVAHRRLAR